MAVRRGPRPSDQFAQVSNVLLQDFALSSKARGIAAMLLSFPPGWETTVTRLSKQLERDGYEAVRTAFLELEECGYLIRSQQRLPNGRMGDLDQWIFDDPRDAAAFRAQLDAETSPAPGSGNPITDVTSTNGASSQVGTVIGFLDDGPPDIGQPGTTKTEFTKTDLTKTKRKTSGRSSSSSSPSVSRGTRTTTPEQKLTDAGLGARDRGRFREYLRTVKGARSTEAVIMMAERDDLAAQVKEWRRSLDITTEPDAEPLLCDHGHDVALGLHMCPLCDPDRPRRAKSAPAAQERPEWLQEALASGEHGDLAALLDGEAAS